MIELNILLVHYNILRNIAWHYTSSMKVSMIIVAVSLGCVSANCMSSFNRLNKTTQTCLGSNLVFKCSTIVERLQGSTVFRGDLLDCEIALLHDRFNTSADTSITCNNGMVVGYSLPVYNSSNCYISQLRIMVTPNTTGKSISCEYDNGTISKIIGNFFIEDSQCYTTTVITKPPTTAPSVSVQTVETIAYENSTGTGTMVPTHYKDIKSLSTGEATCIAIVLCCSALMVGIMIATIILLTFRFKKQLQAIQTPNSVHNVIQDDPVSTSPNANLRQQTQTMFYCAQDDEVSGYTLCTTDYDRIVIATDDSEYSHLQHPGPQHTLGMKPRANYQLIYM